MSAGFLETAGYLTARSRLSGHVTFQVGDALNLSFVDGTFDVVFLQHVAMNVEDRPALYREISRMLTTGSRFVTCDLVVQNGDLVYPVPWARSPKTSFLFSEEDTRKVLLHAGFEVPSGATNENG